MDEQKQGVVAVGECMIELSRERSDSWRMGYAGDTFNTLWTLRALLPETLPTDYFTGFGDDPFSAGQKSFIEEQGIGALGPTVPGKRPGLYIITLDGAERSFTYWREDTAARRLADDPARLAGALQGRSLIYFSGITLAILTEDRRKTLLAAMAEARAAGARIAFDPNHRARLWPSDAEARASFEAGYAVADILLPTFDDEKNLFGDASPEATVDRLGAAEIAVKNGSEAALVLTQRTLTTVPAVAAEAVDTTGAGDAFNGAYLAARLLGDVPPQAAARAHRVAAAVVQVRGALAPFDVLRSAFMEGGSGIA